MKPGTGSSKHGLIDIAIYSYVYYIYLHLPKGLNFSLFPNISLRTFQAKNETSGGKWFPPYCGEF